MLGWLPCAARRVTVRSLCVQLVHEDFQRSPEQDEELGLTHMDTRAADAAYDAEDQQAAADKLAEERTRKHCSSEASRQDG